MGISQDEVSQGTGRGGNKGSYKPGTVKSSVIYLLNSDPYIVPPTLNFIGIVSEVKRYKVTHDVAGSRFKSICLGPKLTLPSLAQAVPGRAHSSP